MCECVPHKPHMFIGRQRVTIRKTKMVHLACHLPAQHAGVHGFGVGMPSDSEMRLADLEIGMVLSLIHGLVV